VRGNGVVDASTISTVSKATAAVPLAPRVAADFALAAAAATGAYLVTTRSAVFDSNTLWSIAAVATAIVCGVALLGAYGAARNSIDPARLCLGILVALATLVIATTLSYQRALDNGALVAACAVAFPLFMFSRRPNLKPRRTASSGIGGVQTTIVVGSRDAARAVLRLLESNANLPFDVIGCVDDDPRDHVIEGIPVIGTTDDLERLVQERGVENVIVAATSGQPGLVKKAFAACSRAKTASGKLPSVKVIPNLQDLLMGHVSTSRIRNVRLDDLLQREPVKFDPALIAPHLENKVVLVTGAGGSIGSELCRQIIRFKPRKMLLVGHGENSLFAIDQELRSTLGYDKTSIVLADVADGSRIRRVFSEFRPHVVFHAAAHKHVPILEENVCEAVRNNVFGTHVVALAAAAAGVAKFVMVSTDKAVNPSSIMGATKRVAELICRSFERRTGTEFVSVRFGNVLGSRGSVINVFKRQIESGGPLTITHPDMVRYFMTIPEAVTLVLEAMAIGRDGQVFVMHMGEPVRVVELAENLLRLSGLKPYKDIDIVFTGVRPGEKMFEEMMTNIELENPTRNDRLFIAQQSSVEYEMLARMLKRLDLAVRTPNPKDVVECMRELVPTFKPGAHLVDGDWKGGLAAERAAAAEAAVFSANGSGTKPGLDLTPNGVVAPATADLPGLTNGSDAAVTASDASS
jgi:FlaA1/EpsC-like NDP-sugar epimerase